jgi:hypothetical protein
MFRKYTMEQSSTIINTSEKYLMPGPDQVRFASVGQTLSLVLGSCISTVFIGRNSGYILSANHIMIAREHHVGVIAKKSARQQIDEILDIYHDELRIPDADIRCLHLVGAGKKVSDETFRVHDENIAETRAVLSEKSIIPLFDDTRSYYFATYSLSGSDISVFIEDKLGNTHLSYIIDLQKLFSLDLRHLPNLPASALKPCNRGFEEFVELGAIVFITGERNRANV